MRPARPNKIRESIQRYADRPTPTEFPQPNRGPIIKALDETLGGSENRYKVLGWLFTPDWEPMTERRSGELSPQAWSGLKHWLGSKKVGDDWLIRETFDIEARWILTRASYVLEQTKATNYPIGFYICQINDDEPVDLDPGGAAEAALCDLGGDITAVVTGEQLERVIDRVRGVVE